MNHEPMNLGSTRVAVVVSHPIQHFCPQYSSWAKLPGVDLRVFFASRHGLAAYEDKGFGRVVQWGGLILDFPHEFLERGEDRAIGEVDGALLRNRLREFAPDVVVVYGYVQALARSVLAWAAGAKVPLLMIADSELRWRRAWANRAAKALLLPRVFRKVDLFLTVGDANDAYYRRYGVGDERLIRCFFPIDVKHYDRTLESREDARARVRQEHGIPDGHHVVLMVGKLVPWKRQSDLVAFSRSLEGKRHDVTVVLAGTGPEEARLRKLAPREGPGGVVFAGFISPEKLAEYYCASDVYVHCSEREPHSLAISEAIYCGLPVVVSDRCGSYGPSDDVRVGLNGYVYRCGDVSALSSAILRIVDSGERLGAMGAFSAEVGRRHQDLAHGRALLQALDVIREARDRNARLR